MRTWRLKSRIRVEAPVDRVFDFFSRAENLERITPGWLSVRVLTPTPIEMGGGTAIDYRLVVRGVPIRWRSRIVAWDPPRRFADLQERGPYRLWHHVHEFEPDGDGTVCRDRVTYAVPGGALVHALVVRRDVEAIFRHRHARLAALLGGGEPGEAEIDLGRLA